MVDNVLHDWRLGEAPLFDPRLAVETLVPLGFDVLGSSPRVGEDERWFKHVDEDAAPYGHRFVDRFEFVLPGLLDQRVPLETGIRNSGEAATFVDEILRLRAAILESAGYSLLPDFLSRLSQLGSLLPSESRVTVAAIDDFCGVGGMAQVADGAPFPAWPDFRRWWGRGVFFVSFWRKCPTYIG